MTQWTPCESGGWRRLWPWLQSVCTITDTSIASAVRPPDALQCYPSCCTSTAAAWFSLSLSHFLALSSSASATTVTVVAAAGTLELYRLSPISYCTSRRRFSWQLVRVSQSVSPITAPFCSFICSITSSTTAIINSSNHPVLYCVRLWMCVFPVPSASHFIFHLLPPMSAPLPRSDSSTLFPFLLCSLLSAVLC